MILDIPYRSRVYNLTKDSSELLAYIEEERITFEKSNSVEIRYQVECPERGRNFVKYLTKSGRWSDTYNYFETKDSAMAAIKKHYKL